MKLKSVSVLPRFLVRDALTVSTHPQPQRQLTCGQVSYMRGKGRDRRDIVSAESIIEKEKSGVFRILEIEPKKREWLERKKWSPVTSNMFSGTNTPPNRADRMKPDQDWGSVWPAARTFHPASVPLPVRQGVVVQKAQVVPSKWANAELMKIPNFLHLTPTVIKKHCDALKKFCTPWPQGLETEADTSEHFPLTVITSDYLNSSSSIRDRRARVVTFRFHVDSLQLDSHARDKLVRLVEDRYDEETGEVTLTADRCPYRGQNEDYVSYLLTALYHESWVQENWETEKTLEDEEVFDEENFEAKDALGEILNRGEDEDSVRRYREEVRKLLDLPEPTVVATTVNY